MIGALPAHAEVDLHRHFTTHDRVDGIARAIDNPDHLLRAWCASVGESICWRRALAAQCMRKAYPTLRVRVSPSLWA
jgi:hypothetical protein